VACYTASDYGAVACSEWQMFRSSK